MYRFAAEPSNLPRWAAGLATAPVERDGDDLVVHSPMGSVRVRFVAANELGVLDHVVTLPSGERVHNPMRVLPNGTGSEVVFSIFQRPGVSDADFAADVAAVQRDLETLAALLSA